jgi:acyl transferase domain-containing protein
MEGGRSDTQQETVVESTPNTNSTNKSNLFEARSMEPIAVVGMGMRLPGGIHNSEDFWKLLVEKRSTRCRVPSDRFNIDAYHSPSRKVGSVGFEYGHFLAEVDNLTHLDTSFFSMSRKEVEKLDPQQRMLLEVIHECMENGGQTNWRGKDIGVYVGVWGEVSQTP